MRLLNCCLNIHTLTRPCTRAVLAPCHPSAWRRAANNETVDVWTPETSPPGSDQSCVQLQAVRQLQAVSEYQCCSVGSTGIHARCRAAGFIVSG